MEQVPKKMKGKALTSAIFMATRKSVRLKRPVENTTPDEEYCLFLTLTREVVIEDIMRAVWPIVEAVTHRLGFVTIVTSTTPESFDVAH